MRPINLPPPLYNAWSWQLDGNCRGYPIELFYPESARGHALRKREEAAKLVCRDCPVLAECRDHALNAPEVFGVWGAMTERERADRLGYTRRGTMRDSSAL